MRSRSTVAMAAALAAALCAGCKGAAEGKADGPVAKPAGSEAKVSYRNAFPGATFERPVFLGEVPGKPGAFLILEQPGVIRIAAAAGGRWATTEFAKIDVAGGGSGGDERGLLGFAFHPGYPSNRRYYVYFVRGSADVLAEGVADPTLLKDSGSPLRILLSIPDPFPNHNGGTLAFGPKDGFLYLGIGDGGSHGDPYGNGQNRNALLGKFLRLDVDSRAPGKQYGIPKDNPFAQGGGAPEVWAYGLRNPWKWSFDPVTGELWAGDVGQDRFEEVDRIEKGGNYGWNAREGDDCFPEGRMDCPSAGFQPPLHVYGRDPMGGISVTGGVVYRGRKDSPFFGAFLFGDYGTGNVWSLDKSGSVTPLAKPPPMGISSFNTDAKGDVYIMGINSDTIYRMEGF